MALVSRRIERVNQSLAKGADPDTWAEAFHNEILAGHLEALELGAKRGGQPYHVEDWQDAGGNWHQGLRAIARGMADEESQFLQGYTDTEGNYHRGFIEDLRAKDPRYFDELTGDVKTAAIDARTDLYVGKMRGSANRSFVDASPADSTFTWKLGAADHCLECPGNATILVDVTADELYAYPGDGSTECLGNCTCVLERNDGVTGFGHHSGAPAVAGDEDTEEDPLDSLETNPPTPIAAPANDLAARAAALRARSIAFNEARTALRISGTPISAGVALPDLDEVRAIGAEVYTELSAELGADPFEHYTAARAAIGDYDTFKAERVAAGADPAGRFYGDWRDHRDKLKAAAISGVQTAVSSTLTKLGITPGSLAAAKVTKISKDLDKAAIDRALGTFPSSWLEDRPASRAFEVKLIKTRAYYSEATRKLTTDGDIGTTAHEFAHSIERYAPVLLFEREYFNLRTAGEKEQKLAKLFPNHGYKRDETTKVDKWPDAYMGKSYLSAYELVSMFFGALNGDHPEVLSDRDFVEFCLGLMVSV